MDRMKKCPLKELTRNPLLHRTRHTASHAVNRVRLCASSFFSLGPSRSTRNAG